jgi:hypothetical protein
MVTIHRAHGLRFVIYTQDHEPAHVHVLGDGELKIALSLGGEPPVLVYAIGMKAAVRRRAMDMVLEHQAAFLARWQAIHGDGT